MKKNLLLAFVAIFTVFAANAQTTIFEDNFDSYSLGDYLAEQSDVWTTWSNNPGSSEDALITDVEQSSAPFSVVVEGSSDLVLPMGNRTSGVYDFNFKMFVASGFAGYYNVQHFEAPGNEWAYEVYFGDDGNGTVSAGGEDAATFTYTPDTWLTIENHIDVTNDNTILTINGDVIYEWAFSLTANGGAGELQLGGANFYAGGPSGQTPKYYLDDLEYIEVESGAANATVEISEESISTAFPINGTATADFTISNVGEQDLEYTVYDTYPAADAMSPIQGAEVTNISTEITECPNPNPGTFAPSDDWGYLSYDGDVNSGIGTNGGEMRCAALFPPSKVDEFIGMALTHVDVYILDDNTYNDFKIQIYSKGSVFSPGPGTLIHEQDASPAAGEYSHIELTTPIYLDGNEISIGYYITHDDEQHPAACDAGPADLNGDWISTGPGWSHLSDNPDLNYNWSIKGYVQGTPLNTCMEFLPWEGTIAGGASNDITITIDGTDLEAGQYSAIANVRCNDPESEFNEIPVTIDIFDGIDNNKAAVAMYPNPATSQITVSGVETEVESVEIYNQAGQLVKVSNETTINISDLSAGYYMVTIKTTNGNAYQKLSVR